ncbi:putative serine/threonine-protein kinase ATM [Plasmopara halstedii]
MRPAASDATLPPFNPLMALQLLLSAGAMSVKKRVKAAQQLEEYFRHLSPTPGLLMSYEPYLPLLMDVLLTPMDDSQELQTSVMAMLLALSAHNPTGFSNWIGNNRQPGYEPWLVQWSYALLLQTEKTVPRDKKDDDLNWQEESFEFKQFDRVFAGVMQMWRTLLDHTADVALVDQLVKYLQALLMQSDTNMWHLLMLKKLQPHFVDVADVLVGWMMSTGPHSPLREEILALSNNFGRLWADNSVFSLQLMNSFVDEILSLCEYWNQDGDSDRLSTLLTCFMMVAQCVPVLGKYMYFLLLVMVATLDFHALLCVSIVALEGAESPFKKVLDCVAACPQPEYSIFCLANCSDYLVSVSNSGQSSFAPQSIAAIGFLLHHCAVQSCLRDCEVDKILTVLCNACKLANANFSSISDSPFVQSVAISILGDEISSRYVNKSGQFQRVKLLDCLLRLEVANVVPYVTQLCLQLVKVGGIGAVKVFGESALQNLNDLNGETKDTYFVFAATCFILVSRDLKRLNLVNDNCAMHVIAIFDLISATLKKTHRCQPELTPRQLCLVLKMACAFLEAICHHIDTLSDVVETMREASLHILEFAIGLLYSEPMVLRNHRLTTDTLQMIYSMISKATIIPLIPQDLSRSLLKMTAKVLYSSSVRVRDKCIRLLEVFNRRTDACNIAKEVFDMILILLLDPSPVIQRTIVSSAFSSVARSALSKQISLCKRRSRSQYIIPSFVGADFESIFCRFLFRECDESEWSRVCRSIMARTKPNVAFGNTGVLLGAVRQAAAWCVQNRLRTFIGGPAQNFASIERLLQEYSDEAQNRAGVALQNNNADNLSCTSSTNSIPHQLLNWLLLEFVNELELRMTLAIRAPEMDQSKSESEEYKTVLFFRTNKVVCDDWLNRIRPYLVEMTKCAPCYELKRYHCHALMIICYNKLSKAMTSYTSFESFEVMTKELTQAEKDLDAALFSLCQCHCDAKDADSIIGFQQWSVSLTTTLNDIYQLQKGNKDIPEYYRKMPLFKWLIAIRYEAEMRYEDAAMEYETVLDKVLAPEMLEENCPGKIFESPMYFLRMSPSALLGCIKQCAQCYAALREWTKLRKLVSRCIDLVSSLVNYNYPIEEINAILSCCDCWSNKIGIVSDLETSTDDTVKENDQKEDHINEAAQALRVWDAVAETNLGPSSASLLNQPSVAQLRQDLIPLALQPSPWNGYVGEKIGKNAEEIVLRLFNVLHPVKQSPPETVLEIVKLNPKVYDSITWAQTYCRPRWNSDAESLHLSGIARLARKQHNYSLAQALLKEAENIKDASLVAAMTLIYEKAKLLEASGMMKQGRELLETQCGKVLQLIGCGDTTGIESVATRSFLHLAGLSGSAANEEYSSSAVTLFASSAIGANSIKIADDLSSASFFTPNPQDAFADRCFQTALALSPHSAKAWTHYSHWCYGLGKREMKPIIDHHGYVKLNFEDESELNGLMDEIGLCKGDRDQIFHAFCQVLEKGDLISKRIENFRQLCTELALSDHNQDAIDRLMRLHRKCHLSIFHYHALAARGYGKYLIMRYSDSSHCIPRQEGTMIVLRMLGILTQFGSENEVVLALQDVILHGPVIPWSYVVPQVIARANHSVPIVATLICSILKRLAARFPHAIVYPAVVDAMDFEASGHAEDYGVNRFSVAVLKELQNASSGQLEGVRLLVSELCRISILWDENWISTLVKLSADVSRRVSTLEKEACRLEKNTSLSTKEKYELTYRKMVAIMKPIYVSISELWEETCGNARDHHALTPHERNFLVDYGRLIDKAMTNFRDGCNAEYHLASRITATDLWQPFVDILTLMNARGNREQLPLLEISPAMASTSRLLALTNIPGAVLESTSDKVEPINIHRLNSSVTVLRTKTRPKSLEVIGSDGKTYSYLLKAREDLRLDERIMQFLRVTNDFLKADDDAGARDLSAQSYSVIPLSKNAGLIQMVPHVIPLFQVYTSQNDAMGRAQQESVAESSAQQQPSPPTAQFYAKLKQHGITNVSPSNRSQWPVSVLNEVYQELVAQRPRNVVQQEILVQSEDLRQSWTKITRFCNSLAVMSILGYIIGLGDRHLDNILLCIVSGDIVHIDYNVCFDKGRRLKVSEIVPFRLTPMLQDALGVTGVEGKFRTAFETTLRIVRSDHVREALLTLIEAFVYSPLVDWNADDKRQGREVDLKARLEANVNLSLFLSRAEERRQVTIAFGRQFEQCADFISKTFTESAVPFLTMLEKRKLLMSLEWKERTLLKEVSSTKAELSTIQEAEKCKRAELASLTARCTDIADRLTNFAADCFKRHRHIQELKQKCVTFAESDPLGQLEAVTIAVDTTSFQVIHATLRDASKLSTSAGSLSQLVAALESKCRLVDANVIRSRFEIKKIADYLIPFLSSYGHQRKELDAYITLAQNFEGKDVYFKWWKLCTEYLRGLVEGQTQEYATSIMNCPTPSEEDIAESRMVLSRLDETQFEVGAGVSSLNEASRILLANKLLQITSNDLFAMNLSNAQGQRLLKLAGASWIVEALEHLDEPTCYSNVGAFTPSLKVPQKFEAIASMTHACCVLLNLVSTPKGSMKRLRTNDLFALAHDRNYKADVGKCLIGFYEVLQEIGSFSFVLQDEFISNLYGRDFGMSRHLQKFVKEVLTTSSENKHKAIVSLSMLDVSNGSSSSIQTMLTGQPGLCKLLVAGFAIIQKISVLVENLCLMSIVTGEEAARISDLSSTTWLDFERNVVNLFAVSDYDADFKVQETRTLWSAHIDNFVSKCLSILFRYQLFSIIIHEWKFDFNAFDRRADKTEAFGVEALSERWTEFSRSQIEDILPSTMNDSLSATLKMQASNVTNSVVKLMTTCNECLSYRWGEAQLNAWAQHLMTIKARHVGRIRYATWLAGAKPAEDGFTNLTRTELVACILSQVPQLNALLTDQVALQASVTELTQQLDYLASNISNISHSTNENLHTYIHNYYDQVAGLVDYGRTLGDLVQGISLIETSSGEIKLEVDTAGTIIIQSASSVILEMQSLNEALDVLVTQVQEYQGKLQQTQDMYDAVASKKVAAESELHSLCLDYKHTVVEVAHVLSKYANEMRALLNNSDALKDPSNQRAAESVISSSVHHQVKANTRDAQSTEFSTGYLYSENDRLVQMLLRSIQSVNHYQVLKEVLKNHGEQSILLRDTISQLDRLLSKFVMQVGQNLSDDDKCDESSQVYLLSKLLLDLMETLQIGKNETEVITVCKSDGSSNSPLFEAQYLLRGCLKLFFKATEMANHLSSIQNNEIWKVTSMPDEIATEDKTYDNSAILEFEEKLAMDVSSDCNSNDVAAKTSMSVEEKSLYGLQVLKRIEEKLSGFVPEVTAAPALLTVEQQASWLIDQATNIDNLCLMYEGWTPWI